MSDTSAPLVLAFRAEATRLLRDIDSRLDPHLEAKPIAEVLSLPLWASREQLHRAIQLNEQLIAAGFDPPGFDPLAWRQLAAAVGRPSADACDENARQEIVLALCGRLQIETAARRATGTGAVSPATRSRHLSAVPPPLVRPARIKIRRPAAAGDRPTGAQSTPVKNAQPSEGAESSVPLWVFEQLTPQQQRVLRALWDGKYHSNRELKKKLQLDGKDPDEALRQAIARTGTRLFEKQKAIGEQWEIESNKLDNGPHYRLRRTKSDQTQTGQK